RNFYVARCIEQKRVLIVGKNLRRPGEATNEIALPVDALAKADWARAEEIEGVLQRPLRVRVSPPRVPRIRTREFTSDPACALWTNEEATQEALEGVFSSGGAERSHQRCIRKLATIARDLPPPRPSARHSPRVPPNKQRQSP